MKMKKEFKEVFKMLVSDNKLAFITVEITTRNKYLELSITGEWNGHRGQVNINKDLKGITPLQKKLFKLWKEKHLKKVNATEQKEIKNLITDLQNEYKEQTAEQKFSEIDEEEALKLLESFSEPEKVLALCLEEEISVSEISTLSENGDNRFSYGGHEYLICTDEEADDAQDEEFENYLDECILPELPKQSQRYFESDAWKSDAKHDGRGHSLGRYDGNENEQNVNEVTYFLYRQ